MTPNSRLARASTHRQLARRFLAALAHLLPVNSQLVYRALRWVYRRIPLPLERKMPWGQHLLADVPPLQQVAYRVAGTHELPASLDSYIDQPQIEGPLLPAGRRVLVVEHRLPTPDRNSSSVRLFAMLKLMREIGWQVTFLSNTRTSDYRGFLPDPATELPMYEQAISALGIEYLYGMEALIEHLRQEGGRYRFAVLSYPEIMHQYAPIVRAFMPHAELIYDTVDLHGMRFAREAEAIADLGLLEKAAYYQRMEVANVECADAIIAISETEQREILKNVPAARSEIVTNIHTVESDTPDLEARDGLIFIGHYLHTPNADALIYFINEVLPRIEQQLPGIPFYALGSSITTNLKRFDSGSIHMIGYVEDVRPWFAKARVFVAPLRYGAGMKGKIGQSLALGLPVVTTSIGAEGMQLEHGKNVLIADAPGDFADAAIRLSRDSALWRMLSVNGKAHIAARFSEAVAREALLRLLHDKSEAGLVSG